MDFSQLPKMSNTPTTPTVPGEPEPATPVAGPSRVPEVDHPRAARPDANFGGIWMSATAALIFLYSGQTFFRYLIATLGGHDFPTGWLWEEGTPKAGQPRTYFELRGGSAYMDMGVFLMGVVLLIDAAAMLVWLTRSVRGRGLIIITIGFTALVMVLNAAVIAYVLANGFGLPLVSVVALAVGGFVLFDHLPLLRRGSHLA